MRITLTTRRCEEVARRSGASFKAVISATIRRGLEQPGKAQPPRAGFVVQPEAGACGFRNSANLRNDQLVGKIDDFEYESPVSTARR